MLLGLISVFLIHSVASPLPNSAKLTQSVNKDSGDRFADLKNKNFKSERFAVQEGYHRETGEPLYSWKFPEIFSPDIDLGYTNVANSQARTIIRTENELVFDFISTNDEYGRRASPEVSRRAKSSFIALFGCSFTYGAGVNDNQTINAFISQNENAEGYNYGIIGTGLNSMLALAQKTNFKDQIPEKKGLFVYVYITPHIFRSVALLPFIKWLKHTPYFEIDSENKMVRNGSWSTGRPYYIMALEAISYVFGTTLLKNRVFPSPSQSDYDYFCRLAEEMANTFSKKVPANKFVFYVHPLSDFPPEISQCLRDRKIDVRFGKKFDDNAEFVIRGDGHPNAKANESIAKDLIEIATENR